MIIKVLSENTASSEKFGCEHGLSLYIETENHRILFDTGASGLFAENAGKLGADLSRVDVVVISHGHYDHGGGLKTFLGINGNAKIYLNQKVFEKHYSNRAGGIKAFIGLDDSLIPNERFVFCSDKLTIDGELELFSDVEAKKLNPSGNEDLFKEEDGKYIKDDFSHEQNLVINGRGKRLLIAGCAHKGIVNIIDRFYAEKDCYPDYVIGGFHLYNHSAKKNEAPVITDEIGKMLLETHAKYYTCHCTGIESYNRLKTIMGKNIDYISAGDQINIII